MDILNRLECEIVKIDKVFVDNITNDAKEAKLIGSINQMANIYGSSACVEGVESMEQYEIVKACGVSSIQGYYFSKPLPVETFFEKYVAE